MSFFKCLLFSLLLCAFLDLEAVGSTPNNCDSLEVFHELKAGTGGKFKVIVSVKGGVTPIQYLFYSNEGSILSKDLSLNSIQNLNKGKYFCIVRDNKNCRKTIEIEIKG